MFTDVTFLNMKIFSKTATTGPLRHGTTHNYHTFHVLRDKCYEPQVPCIITGSAVALHTVERPMLKSMKKSKIRPPIKS